MYRTVYVWQVLWALLLLTGSSTWSWNPSTATRLMMNRRQVLNLETSEGRPTVALTLGTLLVVANPRPSHANDPDQDDSCDEACRQERLEVIRQRRAMMQQSKSTTSRQEVFDLSRQRAAVVFNTTYQGATCPPGAPCW